MPARCTVFRVRARATLWMVWNSRPQQIHGVLKKLRMGERHSGVGCWASFSTTDGEWRSVVEVRRTSRVPVPLPTLPIMDLGTHDLFAHSHVDRSTRSSVGDRRSPAGCREHRRQHAAPGAAPRPLARLRWGVELGGLGALTVDASRGLRGGARLGVETWPQCTLGALRPGLDPQLGAWLEPEPWGSSQVIRPGQTGYS